ncbi:MAG TPA: DEAD/DEAH box helicase, partial [Thermoanaerobaculia bacterium]|nr:DEAD/DEAH box helicase [Thermoanaerobaculia bacterium]
MRGIGPARATELAKAGVETVLDLLLHLPFRYEDRSRIAPISALVPDGPATTVKGAVLSSRLIRTRRFRFTIFEAILDDGSGTVRLVFFNQPYLEKQLAKGKTVYAYGAPELATGARRGLVLKNPSYELEETDDPLSVGRVVPIYRKLPGLTPRLRRRTVASLLDAVADRLPERLPAEIRARLSLPSLAASLHEAHFPGSAGGSTDPMPWESRRSPHLMRLVFEEFLEFQLLLTKRRRSRALATAPRLVADDAIRARLKEVLPFALTKAQRRVITEIRDDVRSGRPMRRLLQGDVGSGKTIVAVLSALLAAERGYQTAFMAPTEVLAEQHARTVFHLLARTRFRGELLTGRVKGKKRSALLDQLAGGRIDVLVGTHALLTDPVAFLRLGLAVVDEQHRFGVAQRAALS